MKIFFALIISLLYLILLLVAKPYRKQKHTIMQAFAMALPVISMAWALAGGWENEHKASSLESNDDDATTAFDSLAVVILHAVILIPPVLFALFSACASLYVWILTKRRKRQQHHDTDQGRDQDVGKPHKSAAHGIEAASKPNPGDESWDSCADES